MSSCWTLRLKRRSAFSNGSPSCTRTSAKVITPPNLPRGNLYDTGFLCFRHGLSGGLLNPQGLGNGMRVGIASPVRQMRETGGTLSPCLNLLSETVATCQSGMLSMKTDQE